MGEVAGPGLEGGQVATLPFTRRKLCHAMNAAYSCIRVGVSPK